jgi:D-beta-D-heptose 7-phosphate kinase / D-beta-D-heptose 1-phosphate adenosyltransferase
MNFSDENTPKILVVGDLMIDHYFWGSTNRISPEAPVPVIEIENESTVLGGAGNVLKNLYAFGSEADILSVIGSCGASKTLKELLTDININTQFLIVQKNRFTSKKSRIIAAQQQVVRFDLESTSEINRKSKDALIKIFEEIIDDYDIVLLSDYNKGIFSYDLTQALISIANQKNIKILVDPKGSDYSKYKGAFLLTPNKKEASEATKILIKDDESLKSALIFLKDFCDLSIPIITLSEDGVAVLDEKLKIYPTLARQVFDVTGAGDTVLASLGFALSCQSSIGDAIRFANLASGVVVGKIGSATASLNEINEYESSLNQSSSEKHIKTLDALRGIVKKLKNNKHRIVFTNGCFDLLHIGHVRYLEESKSFGDVLIIGLNSDSSVKKIKGFNRPINSENDRASILASLEVVDFVVIFDEDTPIKLINLIKPDILVKGGDYKNKEIIGKDIAKEVRLVDFLEGKSTTKTIEKIKNS